MQIFRSVLLSIWLTAFAVELLIWVATASLLGLPGIVASAVMIAVSPVLFAAEGAELSINALVRRKEPGLSQSAARELASIEADRSLSFFANRQAFVPICVVTLALATSVVIALRGIYIPGIGWSNDAVLCFLFDLLFPIHITLLCLQIPPKMLAIYAPGRFLNQTWPVIVAVRWLGKSEVAAPAIFVTRFLGRLLRYPMQHTPTPPIIVYYVPVHNDYDGWYYIMMECEPVTVAPSAALNERRDG